MKKIVIIKGASQYGALRIFADEITRGFIELGCQCTIVDLLSNTDELNNNLDKIKECDFLFTFNGVAISSKPFTNFLNGEKKVVINFYVDHPHYHVERINSGLNHCINIFICKSQIESANLISKGTRDLNVYIPHGGLKLHEFKPSRKQFLARKNRILFSGSSNLTDSSRPWSNKRPSDRVCDATYDLLLLGKGFSEAYDFAIKQVGVSFVDHQQNFNFRHVIFQNTVPYFRARNRFDTIKQLVKSGLPVDVYGDEGWASVAQALGVIYKGMLPMNELVKTFQEYKYIVNDFCAHPQGSHERVINVALNGGCLISYENDFLNSFENIKYISYNSTNIEQLSEQIKNSALIDDFEATLHNFVLMEKHQWYKRSKDIIDIFELYTAVL